MRRKDAKSWRAACSPKVQVLFAASSPAPDVDGGSAAAKVDKLQDEHR